MGNVSSSLFAFVGEPILDPLKGPLIPMWLATAAVMIGIVYFAASVRVERGITRLIKGSNLTGAFDTFF